MGCFNTCLLQNFVTFDISDTVFPTTLPRGQVGQRDQSDWVVRINQVVQVGGSGELGGPDGQGGQDNQPRYKKLYGFHGLTHQIIKKS